MKQIDLATWNRREIFEMFSNVDYPFYSITIPVDVTLVKEFSRKNKVSFYYLMVWVCTKALNEIPAFRMRIRGESLVELDSTVPSFTVMEKGDDVFRIITTPMEESPISFCEKVDELARTQKSLHGQGDNSDELIYFSCAPWFDFTSLTNEHNFNKADTIPRLAWGKYYLENERLMIHLSIEVNHRTIDGYHLGLLKNGIDRIIEELSMCNSNSNSK